MMDSLYLSPTSRPETLGAYKLLSPGGAVGGGSPPVSAGCFSGLFYVMTIQFAYEIDQLVFYLSGYQIKYGRIQSAQFSFLNGKPYAEYLIDQEWRKERHISLQHLALIQTLLNIRP